MYAAVAGQCAGSKTAMQRNGRCGGQNRTGVTIAVQFFIRESDVLALCVDHECFQHGNGDREHQRDQHQRLHLVLGFAFFQPRSVGATPACDFFLLLVDLPSSFYSCSARAGGSKTACSGRSNGRSSARSRPCGNCRLRFGRRLGTGFVSRCPRVNREPRFGAIRPATCSGKLARATCRWRRLDFFLGFSIACSSTFVRAGLRFAGILRCHVQKSRGPQQCGNVELLPAPAVAILVDCLHPGRRLRTRCALDKVGYVPQS